MITRPQAPYYVPRGVALAFITAALTGLTGALVGKQVMSALGRLVNHQELVLRVLGWCWSGLPFLVLAVAINQRRLLAEGARAGLTYLLAVWAGSGALLLPGRTSNLERRFGSAYPDARPLGFGWGAGALSIFVSLLLAGLVIVLLRRLGSIDQGILNRVLVGLWIIATAAGLVVALLAPLP